jgi:uncharacterized protein
MQVNVAQLLKSGIGAERRYRVDEDIDFDGKKVRVTGDAKLIRTDRSVLVKGDFKAELEIECCRCLEPYRCPIEINFEEEFFPTIDIISGLPAKDPEAEQPGYFTIDQSHIIDMDEAIRQYGTLATPMKPLCKPECAGICPSCGKNLNEGRCDCRTDETDTRLTELKKLLNKDDKKTKMNTRNRKLKKENHNGPAT